MDLDMDIDCSGGCWNVGPPPDAILRMPPPPLPAFLQLAMKAGAASGGSSSGSSGGQQRPANESILPCLAANMCDAPKGHLTKEKLFPGVEYVELPHHDSAVEDNTWFLVLITSCVAVVTLGALLALFLLKCRDENRGNKQTPVTAELAAPIQTKPRQLSQLTQPENILYPCTTLPDNRVLWAALTPRGTQHFIAENYPQDCASEGGYPDDNQYETIESLHFKAVNAPDKFTYPSHMNTYEKKPIDKSTFQNTGFMDYDYEDPVPLIESYQMDDMDRCYQEPDINPYCIVNQMNHEAMGTMRRGHSRPMVSSPTRIENPNLPPLNLHPYRAGGTLRKSSHSRRVSDTNSYSGNLAI